MEQREAEEWFKMVIEHAPNGIIMVDHKGKISFVNLQAEKLFGYKREELLNQAIEVLVPARYRAEHVGHRDNFLADPKARPLGVGRDLYGLHKNGKEIPVEIGLTPIKMKEGLFVLTSIIDITERKHAEIEIKRYANQLKQSNEELEQFAYAVSHDLQEPLRTIAGYLELIVYRYKGKLDSKADEFIGYIVEGANYMKRMINDLLDFSRVATQGSPFTLSDSGAALEKAITNLKGTIQRTGTQITVDQLPPVMADPTQLALLFQNLIGNGIKFCNEKTPQINISAKQEGNEWFFSVRDNGIGIDPEYKDRIFEIFQRLHTQKEYPGTGMGLAICKKIVERHGGRIWVESEAQKGSVFYFTIPCESN